MYNADPRGSHIYVPSRPSFPVRNALGHKKTVWRFACVNERAGHGTIAAPSGPHLARFQHSVEYKHSIDVVSYLPKADVHTSFMQGGLCGVES